MSTNRFPRLKVFPLGAMIPEKRAIWPLYTKPIHFLAENAYILGVAHSCTLTPTIPDASPLKDPNAWRGCRDFTAGDARKSEEQHTWSTRKGAIIAP
jgi:hypothetical protein